MSLQERCLLDELNIYLMGKNVDDFYDWINDNEYDSDAVIDDVCNAKPKDSNIGNYFVDKDESINHFNTIQQYVKKAAFNEVIVIGISGCTRSGKSTLTDYLKKLLGKDNCTTIHQDHYFDINMIFNELKGNWDHPKAIKHDAFYQAVITEIDHYKQSLPENKNNKYYYIILEGFMLYYDNRITKCIDHFIWIEISRKMCYKRRMQTKRETVRYFNDNIWPNHQYYKEKVFNPNYLKDKLLILDGTASVDHCIQISLQNIGRTDIIEKTQKNSKKL